MLIGVISTVQVILRALNIATTTVPQHQVARNTAIITVQVILRALNLDDLKVQWQAHADYEIEALEDIGNVQMGFPVPVWHLANADQDGLIYQIVPAVVDFKTAINSKSIKDFNIGSVKAPERFDPNKELKEQMAYVWNAHFKKGERYHLTTSYSFGLDHTSFYEGAQYPKGKVLWFDPRTMADSIFGDEPSYGAETILYFLHPLKLWNGKPPEEVLVKVASPYGLDVTYLVPSSGAVKCVDSNAIYYRWKNEIPPMDLKISYPGSYYGDLPNAFPKMTRPAQFFAWLDLLIGSEKKENFNFGGYQLPIQLECGLFNRIKKNLGKKLNNFVWIKDYSSRCVKSCNPGN